MSKYEAALYPGDGIGPEVTREAVKVIRAALNKTGSEISFFEVDWGHNHWVKTGRVVPEDYLDILKDYEVILLGALGDPANLADHIALVPLLEMRQSFDQYVNLRPARLWPGVDSPLKGKKPGDIDLVVVRENSEGEYFNSGALFKGGQEGETSIHTSIHTRAGVERILDYGFETARKRSKKLTMATKSNALRHTMVMWDRILAEKAEQNPDIEVRKFHIDALCMNFVLKPEEYDVVVATNLFGDILSDLAGAIVGSLGVSPGGNLNPTKKYPSLFEPVHGSAPDIAGQEKANPVAAILTSGMMLDFLGQEEAAAMVEKAVLENLTEAQVRTPDLGGRAKTSQVGDDIAARIEKM